VVGAGWAGCAAATELAAAGHHVSLVEAARTLGGRARAVDVNGHILDNGQHILLGAYTEALRLLHITGADPERALLRLPLQMRYPAASGGMDFHAPRLPAPWHLLLATVRARGLNTGDKMALLRFSSAARWMNWQLDTDCSVETLLQRFDQTERLVRLMWRPLCIAALNTPAAHASARVFLAVLRDSLGARRNASDMLLPRTNLSALFPQHAAAFVSRHGGEIVTSTAVRQVTAQRDQWLLATAAANKPLPPFDGIVLATPAAQVNALLRDVTTEALVPALAYEAITTCYLQYDAALRLDTPFYALIDTPSKQEWGQFVFDRGQLDASQSGMLAVVIGTSTAALQGGNDTLASAIALQLAKVFGRPELARPLWTRVIAEKRATFACTPALERPSEKTAYAGLALAGDYLASDYPATLESAVRSGVRAARLIDDYLRGV